VVRQELADGLRKFVRKLKADGVKILEYNDPREPRRGIHNSPAMEEIQADMERRFAFAGIPVVPLVMTSWSDVTTIGRLKCHPSIIRLGNVRPEDFKKRVCAYVV
jgi:hypothetical protein